MSAATMKRLGDEAVHHQAAFHVGDARAEALAPLDPKRPPGSLTLGKHRVTMAHQEDVPLAILRITGTDARHQAKAGILARDDLGGDPALIEVGLDRLTDGIDTGMIVGTGIDVDDAFQKIGHRLSLLVEPGDHIGPGA